MSARTEPVETSNTPALSNVKAWGHQVSTNVPPSGALTCSFTGPVAKVVNS